MTSVLNSSSQTAHSVKRPDKSTHSAKPGGHAADASGEFGALFGALMEGTQGQDLAAAAVADGKTSPKLSGLASEVLGPSVHIITTTEPATSDESLMAFARSQGMDEESLAMIFGRKAEAAEAAALDAAAGKAATEATAADVLAAASLRAKSDLAELSAQQAATDASGKIQGAIDFGQDARISWQLGEAAPTGNPTGEPLQPAMFGLNGVRSMLPQAGSAETAKAEQATHPEAANQTLAASLILGAAEASQSARRLQMKQVTQRTDRVAETFPLTATLADSSATSETDTAVETLTVDTGLPDSDLQQLVQQHASENRLTAKSDEQSTAAGQAAQGSDLDARAEQYDKLSQRLAEALGQRLAAQIKKGDWKVEMALRPIDLGKVDIELRMNQGELQASFNASEAGTRDLIVNGLPKLKEVLAQLGMEVASVDVNVRQEGQSGGNPTPGKQSPGIAGIGTKRSTGEAVAPSEPSPARSVKASNDGLDMLV